MKYKISLIDRKTLQPHIIEGYPVVVYSDTPEQMEQTLMRNRSYEDFYCIRERVG